MHLYTVLVRALRTCCFSLHSRLSILDGLTRTNLTCSHAHHILSLLTNRDLLQSYTLLTLFHHEAPKKTKSLVQCWGHLAQSLKFFPVWDSSRTVLKKDLTLVSATLLVRVSCRSYAPSSRWESCGGGLGRCLVPLGSGLLLPSS